MHNTSMIRVISGLLSIIVVASFIGSTSSERCGLMFDASHRTLVDGLTTETIERLRTERSVSVADICRMPVASLQQTLAETLRPKSGYPGEAQAFRYLQQLSSNKQFSTENWRKAHDQVKSMRLSFAKSAGLVSTTSAGLSSTSWESIGPGNIGGRIRSLAFDPDNSNRIYAGAVSGGVWLSEDAGQSWAASDDFMTNLAITTLTFDPTNSNVLYAGTGEWVRGLGIFKSTDKGASWSGLGSTQDDFNFYYVNRLTMLNNSIRLVAATNTGIWTSDDGGQLWTRAHIGQTMDVDVHPFNNDKLVAGTTVGDALFSLDGGQSWGTATGLENVSGRVEIAYAKSSPDIVYATIDNNSGEVWKSIDGGQSYSLVNTGIGYMLTIGSYANALWVDPTDATHIIVGGIPLYRSTDGGITLNRMSSGPHPDQHFIIEHPAYDGVTNKRVYFTNDGGVYTAPDIELAQDNTFGWQKLNNSLAVTQFYGVAVSPDGTVVGGTQDNGTLIYKGDSEGWVAIWGGDGGFTATDPTDSNYIYGTIQWFLTVSRTSDGGRLGSTTIGIIEMRVGANFIAPLILDPNNENRLLAGSRELWVSDDVKAPTPGWVSIKAPALNLQPISAIAVVPGMSDVIYVGHNDGSIYKTVDGTSPTPTWIEITSVQMPQRFLTRIAIDPLNTNNVYVSYGGYDVDNLWKSVDAGSSWRLAVGTAPSSIPPAPIRAIAIHPEESSQVYVGTEVGIFSSSDAGASWGLVNDGPANVSINELIWHGTQTLYAGTFGRGIFRATVNDVVTENLPPILFPIGNQMVGEGRQLVIPFAASDSNGDLIAFSGSGLPGFCDPLIDNGNGTGSIVCNPLTGDHGDYPVSVIVSDNGTPVLNDSEEFNINAWRVSESTFFPDQIFSTSQLGFGSPVALDGNTALVGAPGSPGSASLLDIRNGSVLQSFDNPNPTDPPDSYAGDIKTTVDLSNGRVLISAGSEDLAATDSGAAYLFDAGTGALLRTFSHPNAIALEPGFGQLFGRGVVLDGDYALVAAPGVREAFLFNTVTGDLLHAFSAPPLTFVVGGNSVALSEQFVAIGNIGNFGAVALFDKVTGNFLQMFFNPTPDVSDLFGEAVALDGNRVLIGAGQVDIGEATNAGEAYLFDATTGALLHTFVDPTPNARAGFGRRLDIEGDLLVISSEGDNEVHIFDSRAGVLVQTLTEQPRFGQFGKSVDLGQGYLLVGAPSSEAYLYHLRRFVDIPPDYWAFSFIETLAANGITTGCGGNNYCPEDPVTRAQMAVFLERGMNGSGFTPPAATGNVFLDVSAGSFAASFIEQFFLDGITAGCGNNNYCPGADVTRAQMAVFLLRATHGAAYSPPAASGIFADVDLGHWAVRWIEQLAAEGITVGCGGGNYCPDAPVNRDQMAVFLVRTFAL